MKMFEGTGGEAFAEQLIASGVKYDLRQLGERGCRSSTRRSSNRPQLQ